MGSWGQCQNRCLTQFQWCLCCITGVHHTYTTYIYSWMCLRGSPSSSVLWRRPTVVCMDKHLGTSPSSSLQPLKLHRDIDYVLPTDAGSLYHAVDLTHTAVGLFWLLVRQFGTHCQMNSEIRRVNWQFQTVLQNKPVKSVLVWHAH